MTLEQPLRSSPFLSKKNYYPFPSRISSPAKDYIPSIKSLPDNFSTAESSSHGAHIPPTKATSDVSVSLNLTDEVWWLDVTNPTWDDMRIFGQVG